MKPAIIIGNGPSRKSFDLKEICKNGISFGCNASYREFKSDFLVAIDDKIINEVIQSSYPLERFLVPPFEEQFEPAIFNPKRPRENTGMVAIRYAIKMGFTTIHCLGFDFLLDDEKMISGNVFEGTSGYGPETRASIEDCLRRRNYFVWFINQNPTIKFSMLFPYGLKFDEKMLNENKNLFLTYMV